MMVTQNYRNEDWLRQKYAVEGMTQEEIADLCDVTQKTISEWVKRFGIRGPRESLQDRALPLEERLKRQYEPDGSGCWLWTGATDSDGYGWIKDDGDQRLAHRVSYEVHLEEIPDGKMVLHKCDTPPCVNPAHLYVGTNSDNMKDAWERGGNSDRDLKGENHYNANLTDEEVVTIRERMHTEDILQRDLADEYGVSQSTISAICRGKRFPHVGGPVVE